MEQPKQSANRSGRRRISVSAVVLAIVTVFCVAGLWLFWQWHRKPVCWQEHDRLAQLSKATITKMADTIESRLLREVSHIGRESNTARIVIPFDQANAWLLLRLEEWARHQDVLIPAPLGDRMVAGDDGQLVIAFAIRTEEIDQVFRAAFDVELLEPGKLTLKVASVHAGRLPIPIGAMVKHLRKSVPKYVLTPIEQLLDGEPVEAVFDHPGHSARSLRVVGFEVESQSVAITLQARPR